jgi:hypothetical protein
MRPHRTGVEASLIPFLAGWPSRRWFTQQFRHGVRYWRPALPFSKNLVALIIHPNGAAFEAGGACVVALALR